VDDEVLAFPVSRGLCGWGLALVAGLWPGIEGDEKDREY